MTRIRFGGLISTGLNGSSCGKCARAPAPLVTANLARFQRLQFRSGPRPPPVVSFLLQTPQQRAAASAQAGDAGAACAAEFAHQSERISAPPTRPRCRQHRDTPISESLQTAASGINLRLAQPGREDACSATQHRHSRWKASRKQGASARSTAVNWPGHCRFRPARSRPASSLRAVIRTCPGFLSLRWINPGQHNHPNAR